VVVPEASVVYRAALTLLTADPTESSIPETEMDPVLSRPLTFRVPETVMVPELDTLILFTKLALSETDRSFPASTTPSPM